MFEAILKGHGGNKVLAGLQVAEGLMQDEPERCKVGYSLENAVLAVQSLYSMTDDEASCVRETLKAKEAISR